MLPCCLQSYLQDVLGLDLGRPPSPQPAQPALSSGLLGEHETNTTVGALGDRQWVVWAGTVPVLSSGLLGEHDIILSGTWDMGVLQLCRATQ